MKSHVGLITQWYLPERGAAAIPGVIARSLVHRGHAVDVVTGFPNYPGGKTYPGYSISAYSRENIEGATVHRGPVFPSHDGNVGHRAMTYMSFAASASAVSLAKLKDVDVALVHSTPATVAIPAMLLKTFRRTPYVVHIEDLWPQTVTSSGFLDGGSTGAAERVLNFYCDAVYRHAAAVAVTSPGMAEWIRQRGVREDKIHFVPNWSDESAFFPVLPDPSLADRLGIRYDFTVMYAGNMGEFQGLEILVEAAGLLREFRRIGFVFVGAGVQEPMLRQLVAERGLDNVSFVGPQPFESMASVLALGDAQFVGLKDVPLFRTTLPSKLQGILAAGRPIVAALKGDAARAVRESGAGLVVEPGSAAQLADSIRYMEQAGKATLSRFGRAGRAFYESNYSESVVADRLSDLLDRAARGRAA